MIDLHISSEHGHLLLGPVSLSWGNSDPAEGHPGYFTIGNDSVALEFGDVDQGAPGIYFTRYSDGDIESIKPLVQFR